MRFYFTIYGIYVSNSHFGRFVLAGHVPSAPISDVVVVIELDLMSKMSAIIRRIITTTNAPAAIGPYRWEFLKVRPKAPEHKVGVDSNVQKVTHKSFNSKKRKLTMVGVQGFTHLIHTVMAPC